MRITWEETLAVISEQITNISFIADLLGGAWRLPRILPSALQAYENREYEKEDC